MKTFKKIACSVLALGLVMGLTACAPKTFEHQKLVDFLEDQDLDDLDDPDDFIRNYSDVIGMSRDIEAGDSPSDKEMLTGVYLRGNTVLIIRALGLDSDFVDDFCEVYGVISPTEA